MHIVFYINLNGGPEALIKNLLPYFQERKINITIVLDNSYKKNKLTFSNDVNIFFLQELPLVKKYLFSALLKFKKLQKSIAYLLKKENEKLLYELLLKINNANQVDIIEVMEGQFINELKKKWKVVTRAHGSNWSFRYFCKDQDNSLDSHLIEWQRKQHLNSDANYAISKHTKEHLTEKCHLPQNLIKFIPYAIPVDKFYNAKPLNLMEMFGISNSSKVILSIGRLESRKGMDVLVNSMPLIWRYFSDAYLILLGNQSEFSIAHLKNLVPEEWRNHILHPGFVNYELVPSFYKAATVYVSASLYETFGYTLLEAMASGIPIVCTNAGAMPELVINDENGIVVPCHDSNAIALAILKILNDEGLQITYGKKGYQYAQNYGISIVGQQMLEEYQKVIQ